MSSFCNISRRESIQLQSVTSCEAGSAVSCALVDWEGLSPLFLLIAARGELAQLFFFGGSLVGSIAEREGFISFQCSLHILTRKGK